jgi:uncharacterized membrane protein
MSLATRLVLWLISAVFSVLMGVEALARYATYHNHTYDLALYARQAWGLAHGDFWDPIIGVHFLGTHVAVVLFPLGLLGRAFGVVPVLLITQALAFGLATLPLAHIGARRFGDAGAMTAAAAWLLYPNVSQVASYEFHPGSLGVLPLALVLNAFDRATRHPRSLSIGPALTFSFGCLALMCCRSDFAILGVLLGGAAMWRAAPRLRIAGALVLLASLTYLIVQFAYLRPHYWAAHTSLDIHFAPWGGSPFGIVRALFTDPRAVFEHLTAAKRLWYVPSVVLPLAFLPLLAPRFLLFTLPFAAINLISVFPTTVELYSHYLTPAVPPLIAAALEGLSRLSRYVPWRLLPAYGQGALIAFALLGNWQSGGLPWSRPFVAGDFRVSEVSKQAARIVGAIPADASVQAPDALLPHLIARPRLQRAPPPDQNSDYVVLDISHRVRYAQREDLLRTIEEPRVRSWLSRSDYGLIAAEPNFLLFQRGVDPRSGIASRYLTGEPSIRTGVVLTRCLSVVSAWLDPQGLELDLAVHAPCPSDLALRLGVGMKPERVDLLFDGLLSPAVLRDERVFSWHALRPAERAAVEREGLRLGAVRSNGAPPEPGDSISQAVPLIH